jgi:predicted DNA-binding protein (MmcQ/YjbR family)
LVGRFLCRKRYTAAPGRVREGDPSRDGGRGATLLAMVRAPHPRVVDPRHPLVERIRAICLAYPEASEVKAWGRPTFRAGRRIFVMVSASMDRPFTIVFKPEADERPAYLADDGFYSPPYWGPGGWLATAIDGPDADWTRLSKIIDTSYRQVALVRQIRALDN